MTSQVNYARTLITIHHHYTEDNQTKEVAAVAEHSKQPKLVLWQDPELLFRGHFASIEMGLKSLAGALERGYTLVGPILTRSRLLLGSKRWSLGI